MKLKLRAVLMKLKLRAQSSSWPSRRVLRMTKKIARCRIEMVD
jgi:hypothetical protein